MSPLSNRRSERPAENSAQAKSTLKECPIFGKTNLQKICITYHKIKKATCFYISKVFQNAIFLFFIYNDIVLLCVSSILQTTGSLFGREEQRASHYALAIGLLQFLQSIKSHSQFSTFFNFTTTYPSPNLAILCIYLTYTQHIPCIYLDTILYLPKD